MGYPPENDTMPLSNSPPSASLSTRFTVHANPLGCERDATLHVQQTSSPIKTPAQSMDFLTELPSSHPLLLSCTEDMTQLVTAPGSVELASKLEELSGLASQIVRCSDKLQTVSQSDFSGNSASVCTLLPVVLSSAQNCLSVLQFIIGQTSISPLYVLCYRTFHLLTDFSYSPPSPPALGPPAHSSIPTSIPTSTFFLPSSVASLTAVLPELDRSVSPAELCRGEYSAIKSRVDSPVVDPRSSTPRSFSPAIDTSHLPANPLDQASPSRFATPATQRWPPPLVRTTPEPASYPTLGGRSDYERSPSSPLLSSILPIRHGVSIAELVDEENSFSSTRGGMNASRSPARCANMSPADSYPLLSIIIIDVTPRSPRRDISETPGISQIESLQSSSPSPPETSELLIAHAPGQFQSPPVSPASSDNHHTSGEGGKTPRRSIGKGSSPTTPEVLEGRTTRSSTKRKAAENSDRTELSKRVKLASF